MIVSYDTAKRLKKSKSLLSIKEFSEMSGVEQSTLRYWDDIGLFRPARRDEDNNYRYYSPEQIMLVNFIKVLSSLNIPLKVIGRISENRSPETILRLMEQQETVLDAELNRLHEAYSTIHTLRTLIREGLSAPGPGHISVQAMEPLPIVLGPANDFGDQSFYQPFMRYCVYAKENRVNLHSPVGGCFDSMDAFLSSPSQPNRFFSVSPQGSDQRAGGKCLVGYVQGYYGDMGDLPQRMAAYAAEHNLKLEGPVYVLYLLDEISVKDPSDYLAQVCVAVK